MSGNRQNTYGGPRKGSGRKRKKAPPKVIPHVFMWRPGGQPEASPGDNPRRSAAALRANNGVILKDWGPLLNPEPPMQFDRVEVVTEVAHKDGSVGFLEVRIKTRQGANTVALNGQGKEKEYKHIFIGDKIWPVDPVTGQEVTERSEPCNASGALMDAGLFVPTNAPAALEHLRRYSAATDEYNRQRAAFQASGDGSEFPERPPPAPVFIWTEGEKSRLGVEAYLDDDEVSEYLEQANLEITTLGVLAGFPGAQRTKYRVRPPNKDFVINGVNDEELRLELATHIYARDSDLDGRKESEQTCAALVKAGAEVEHVKIAEPPAGVPEHWDDGDGLPPGLSQLDRIKQIIDGARPFSEQWIYMDDGVTIDWKDVANQKRSIAEAGISVMYDWALPGPIMREVSTTVLDSAAVESVNGRLLAIMGHRNRVDMRRALDWEISFRELFKANPYDSLFHDTMAEIEKGQLILERKQRTGEPFCEPDMLLSRSFGVEYNRYHRLVSEAIIDGCLALWLRNAFETKEPIVFQWYLLLGGAEGIAKTEWCKVLAGGTPGPGTYERFGSFFDLSYLDAQGDRLNSPIVAMLGNIAVLDIADKAFGESLTEKLDGKLKEFAHVSRLKYRMAYGRGYGWYNRRWLPVITVNKEDIFSLAMSLRRYVTVSLFAESARIIAGGHNSGVNWLFENRSEMLASAFNAGRWRGDVNLSVE